MPDNWDAGCIQARGEYVLLLADKQAIKLRSLERIHSVLERQPAACMRWQCDVLDDARRITLLCREKCDGSVRVVPSDEILNLLANRPLNAANRLMPLGHFGGFHRDLLRRIRQGAVGRLCPPTNPDYTLAIQAMAYSEAVLCFDEALAVTSTRNSNGRSWTLKTHASTQFMKELGGREKTFDLVPVKAAFVHNGVYNDYLRLRNQIQDRLAKYPLNWSNYFIDCHLDIQESVKRGVNMTEELAAWSRALSDQPAAVRQSARTELDDQDQARRKGLRNSLKEFRRVTGISRLEWAIKDRLYALTGKNQTGRFATPLDYVKWEHEQPRSQNQTKTAWTPFPCCPWLLSSRPRTRCHTSRRIWRECGHGGTWQSRSWWWTVFPPTVRSSFCARICNIPTSSSPRIRRACMPPGTTASRKSVPNTCTSPRRVTRSPGPVSAIW